MVALKEGLVVAHSIAEPEKSEAMAAFLPQVFTRLDPYFHEMKLGQVDELLLHTHGADLIIFRLGSVFFAVLGLPGQTLPRNELRLIAGELARQTQR
jgi:predicted regulator of Ras-like GTPase activity (Roadblock/LC7/MglB family)